MSQKSRKTANKKEGRLLPEEDPEFQIAPMVDILLVLLVFFMSISSTEVLQKNQNVNLPVARDAKAKKGDNPGQAVVNVMWLTTGAIELEEKSYPEPDAMVPVLQKRLAANPTLRVLIRADREVRYEYMRAVLAAVGASGVSNVTFSVVDKEGAAAQAKQ